MTVATLRKLAALIRDERDIILARWRRQVRQLPSAQGLSTPSLNDHMPFLLDELADALESQPEHSAEDALLRGSPPAHGRQRLHDGFNVEEVVAEYNVIRGCVHDLSEEHGMVIHGNDLRIVNRIIDEAIGLAVQTFATQLSLEIKKHRDQHMAFVANDLRTPLQAISLTVSIIERSLATATDSEQPGHLLRILRRNIQQLEKSVIEVIKTNTDKPDVGSRKLERRQIDLWPLVEAVISELLPVIASSSVEIANNVPTDLRVFADAGILSRVFENVIAFAINSAPRGIVRVEAFDNGRYGVTCRVHHNGATLAGDDIARLFDFGAAREISPDGIGVGLAIVKQSIEAHGGEASAHSAEADGTTIEFRLPPAV